MLPTWRKYENFDYQIITTGKNIMIETLQHIDASVFTFLNGMHTGYFDQLMWLISNKLAWLLMLVVLLFILLRKGWRQALVGIVAIALVVVIADQVSSSLIKPLVERLRPSHEPSLATTVHLVNGYRGGPFGFVSSHAANHFGVALLLCLMLRDRWVWVTMMCWAAVVSYSRIYLGVHYPGDVICGMMVGFMAAGIVFMMWRVYERRWFPWQRDYIFNRHDSRLLSLVFPCNLLLLAIIAIFML